MFVLNKKLCYSRFKCKITTGVISEWHLGWYCMDCPHSQLFNKSVTGEVSGLLTSSPGCTLTIHYPNPCARFISVNEITAGWK